MAEIQLDVTACKGKFSSSLKDFPAHTGKKARYKGNV